MPKGSGSKPPEGTAQEDAGGAPLERNQAPSETEEPAPAGAPQTPGGDEPPAAERARPAEPPGEPAQPVAEASGGQEAAPDQQPGAAPAAGDAGDQPAPEVESPPGPEDQQQFPTQMSPAEQQVAGGTPDTATDADQTDKEPGPGASDSPGQPRPLGQSGALASHPDAGTEEASPVLVPATSNESPAAAPHPAAAAGKALAALERIIETARSDSENVLGEIVAVATFARDAISGQVPAHVQQVAADEMSRQFGSRQQ